ncbi:MAG: cob(I)yrinic acid a,c-diamide adenosyltransferase [Patescibacteria group bacterium]|nr:cob(I)yrinic acid a,c-diamide adenosyltransferase [Patescibacteria group bacterium]
MLHVYTGDGKGKTTAALGVLVRAIGAGKKIAWVAFDKGGDDYNERITIRERFPEVNFHATGLNRIDEKGKFRFGVTDQDKQEGERGLAIVRDLFANNQHDLIILDEINSSTSLGIVAEADILAILDTKPPNMELILTGRNAPQSFRDSCDLMTEMKLHKHYFYNGTKARPGIDY